MSKLEVICNYVFHPKYQHGTSFIKSNGEILIARNNSNQLVMVLHSVHTGRSTRYEIEQRGLEELCLD